MENTQTMDNTIVLLVGVGGQGTILAGDLLAKTGVLKNYALGSKVDMDIAEDED